VHRVAEGVKRARGGLKRAQDRVETCAVGGGGVKRAQTNPKCA
jgi:hypothetical protein